MLDAGCDSTFRSQIIFVLKYRVCSSDYRSSNVAPSDSERDCSGTGAGPRLSVSAPPAQDSESGGSHPPSPRASRKRQVRQ